MVSLIIDMGEIGGRVANFTMVAIHLDESVGIRVPDTEQLNLAVMKHRIAHCAYKIAMCKLIDLH